NGQFHLDSNGFLVNADNLNVTGFAANKSGQILADTPTNLQLSTAELTPQATSKFAAGVNLDSRTDVPAPLPAFDAANPATYTSSTSGAIFDSLGNSHTLTLFFQKNAPATWKVFAAVDGATDGAGQPVGVTLGGSSSMTMNFDTNGALTAPAGP